MTAYSSLYPSMRILLQDLDSTAYTYPDTTLGASIDFALKFMSSYTGNGTAITPDISGNDELQLILRSVLTLLRPTEGFSYKTPVLSVNRRGTGVDRLVEWLENEINNLVAGGHMPLASDGSGENYLDSASRLQDVLDKYV